MKLHIHLIATFLALSVAVAKPQAAGTYRTNWAAREKVAVIPLTNQTRDEAFSFWNNLVTAFLLASLKQVHEVRVLASDPSALRQIRFADGGKDDSIQAGRFGKIIGARWVIWGNCGLDGEKCLIHLFVIDTATGKCTAIAPVESSIWPGRRQMVLGSILSQMGVVPTEPEKLLATAWTTSANAEEYFGRALQTSNSAEKESWYQKSANADPKFVEAKALWAALLSSQGKTFEALKIMNSALPFATGNAFFHKEYGLVLISCGKYGEAEQAFSAAIQLDPDDATAYVHLGDLFATENRLPQAISSYESALRLDPFAEFVPNVNDKIRYWSPRQAITFISDHPPEWCALADLTNILRQKLSPGENARVINPLASTTAMDLKARDLTVLATNNLEKAQMLFNYLSTHVNEDRLFQESDARTAQEAFAMLTNGWNSLECDDSTYLYVALARSVGLKAYFSIVDVMFDGTAPLHCCAAVFIDDRAVLVDAAQHWFGVPHRSYAILSDSEVVGNYMSSLPDLVQKQIAAKLAPNVGLVQYNLFMKYATLNMWSNAISRLPLLEASDRTGALRLSGEAAVAIHDQDLARAAVLLEKAVKIEPENVTFWIYLGWVYGAQGDGPRARETFQKALECPHAKEDEDWINQILAHNTRQAELPP